MTQHTIVAVFEGDPKDALAAIDGAVTLRQAELDGRSTDIDALPSHRTDAVRGRTQGADEGPSETTEPEVPETEADESDADTAEDQSGASEPVQAGPKLDFASDRAAEVAVELGVNPSVLEVIDGSGKDGALTVNDIRAAAKRAHG